MDDFFLIESSPISSLDIAAVGFLSFARSRRFYFLLACDPFDLYTLCNNQDFYFIG